MARSPKREFLSQFMKENVCAFSGLDNKHFPEKIELLEQIIQALLKRMSLRDIEEAKQIYHKIQLMVVAEEAWENRPSYFQFRYPHMGREEWLLNYGQLLHDIALQSKSNETHWPPAFLLQRELLEYDFRRLEFPEKARSPYTRLQWIKQNRDILEDRIHAIPCYCSYHFSLSALTENTFQNAKSIGMIINTLLAAFHNTTVQMVRKLGKPSKIKSKSNRPQREDQSRLVIADFYRSEDRPFGTIITQKDFDSALTLPFPPFSA
jgi:hypothetical protein